MFHEVRKKTGNLEVPTEFKEQFSDLGKCPKSYQTVKIGRVDRETVCGWKVVGSTLDSAFEADIQALPDLDRFRHVACYVLILRAKGTA